MVGCAPPAFCMLLSSSPQLLSGIAFKVAPACDDDADDDDDDDDDDGDDDDDDDDDDNDDDDDPPLSC